MSVETPAMIKVLVVDDHPLVRLALKEVIGAEEDMEVIAEAEDGEQAVDLAIETAPDVVVMDVSLLKSSGVDATRQIREKCPKTAVFALSVHCDGEHVRGMLEAGATGYLVKTVYGQAIPRTVRAVADGETVLSPCVYRQLLKHSVWSPINPIPAGNLAKLTSREIEILRLAAAGLSSKEIAQHMALSLPTVKNYFAEVFSKLGVTSRTQAVVFAIRTNLVSLENG